jgi:hypothetical protein
MKVLIATLILLAACGGNGETGAESQPSPSPTTQKLYGTMTLVTGGQSLRRSGDDCEGKGGYDDLQEGTQVRILSEDGDLVATTAFDLGEIVTDPFGCRWNFEVEVPNDLDFYSVEASHRGGISYSRSELEDENWIVHLSIGE